MISDHERVLVLARREPEVETVFRKQATKERVIALPILNAVAAARVVTAASDLDVGVPLASDLRDDVDHAEVLEDT